MTRLFILLAVLVGTVLLMRSLGDLEQFQTWVAHTGFWAPILFIMLKAVTYIVAPISGSPLTFAAGPLFGVWEGTLYSLAGDTLGGSVNFWISRLARRPVVEKLVGESNMRRAARFNDRLGDWRNLLFLRIAFAGFYDVLSYATGLTAIPYRQYLVVSVIGGVPATILFVALAANLASDRWMNGLILGGVLAAAITLRIVIGRRWKAPHSSHRRTSGTPSTTAPTPDTGE